MDKIAAYQIVLQDNPLWGEYSLMKLAEEITAADYADAKGKAHIAAGLHGVAHLGVPLTSFLAGYQQRSALRDAGIDRDKGGEGTWGARHPILSGFVPIAGTISGMNAANRIDRLQRAAAKRELKG